VLLAPLFGALAIKRDGDGRSRFWLRSPWVAAALATTIAVAVCVPWTLRNCARMERCVFVSANGGWNLFIGTAEQGHGAWVALDAIGVPPECKTVFGEADKDVCFGNAGLRRIAASPFTWLSLVPAKLATTFDFSGAPGHYLNASNPSAFTYRAKIGLGSVELLWDRLLLALALWAMTRAQGPRARARRIVAIGSVVFLLLPWAWVAHLGLIVGVLLLGPALAGEPALAIAASVVGTTGLTHALFFGAGRYALVCAPAIAAAAGRAFAPRGAGQGEAV
jgi:hypothetical protein